MKYRIYVDEVGNPDLASSHEPNHRFLSLTGVVFRLDYIADTVNPQLEQLKRDFFGAHPDEPIVLHRKDLVNRRRPFEALQDEGVRNAFDGALLDHLQNWEFTAITVCIDKLRHRETYAVWRYHPYHYCLSVLLERSVFLLNRRRAQGDVMAKSRGGNEDRTLKESFARLWDRGTDYVGPDQMQRALTTRQLKVKPKSNNISGLQIADLVAHPSWNEILRAHGLWDKEPAPFARKIVDILQQKYDQQGERVFGKKLL